MAGRFEILTVFKSVDKTTAPVGRMENSIKRFGVSAKRSLRTVNRSVDKTFNGIKRIGGVAKTALFGSAGLLGGFTLLLREFAKVETAEAVFTPLLKSADKAKKLVKELQDTAAETPFQFKDLAKSAKFLLPVMNSDAEKTLATIKMLGDTAGGSAQTLESVTRGYTKAMLKGKADMESLNIIAEAGVPIFTQLAESMGTRVSPAFFKMISSGRITTKMLEKAFMDMTSSSGLFYRGMEIQSLTLAGRFNALVDNISQLNAKLGGIFAPTVKKITVRLLELTKQAKAWVETNKEAINEEFLDFVGFLKLEFDGVLESIKNLKREDVKNFFEGVKSTLVFLREWGPTVLKLIGYFLAFAVVIKAVNLVVAAFNLLAWFNPWVLLIAALVAAGYLIIQNWEPLKKWFSDLWTDLEVGFTSLWDDISDSFWRFIQPITHAIDSIKRAIGINPDQDIGITTPEQDAREASFRQARSSFSTPLDDILHEFRSKKSEEILLQIAGLPNGATASAESSRERTSVEAIETGVFP
jgi:tape measure domain-containing protein